MKIVIKKTNGVAVMTVLDEADVDGCIEKWKAANPGEYVSHREMSDDAIPTDRTFRDAWDDITPEPVIDIDIPTAKLVLQRRVDDLAKMKRDTIVAGVSAAEMASWPIKLDEALKYQQSNDPADAPRLASEAASRAIPLSALVTKVMAKAEAFSALEAVLAGLNGRHNDAIAQMQTVTELALYDIETGWPV